MKKDIEILYKLFRDHEDFVGATHTTVLSLHALIDSINSIKCSQKELKKQIIEITNIIKESQPKIIPLIHILEDFEKEMAHNYDRHSIIEAKEVASIILKRKITEFEHNIERIVENSTHVIKEGDVIIVHSFSTVLKKILLKAKEMGKKFRIIILKQDFIKTKQIIKMLEKEDIQYVVVPEYNMSHVIDKATKLFLGAITVTEDKKVVAAVGSYNIVSLANLHKVPVYLFINSVKFSHKCSREQKIHKKRIRKKHDDVCYCLVSYSHDCFDGRLINHLITEKGDIGWDY